jgi:hypothetical protein
MNGRKTFENNHPIASDSDDEDNETLFSSKIKKTMIP